MCAEDNRNYVTLDDLQVRQLAQRDLGLFPQTCSTPLTIDEIQYAPQLLNHIKMMIDQERKNGLFWLAGSHKNNSMKDATEILTGRGAVIDLLELSNFELDNQACETTPFVPTAEWIKRARIGMTNSKQILDAYEKFGLDRFRKFTLLERPKEIFSSVHIFKPTSNVTSGVVCWKLKIRLIWR